MAQLLTATIEVDPKDPQDHLILYNIEIGRPFLMAGERWDVTSVKGVKDKIRLSCKVVR